MLLKPVCSDDLHYARTLIPQGYNPKIWERVVEAVVDVVEYELEIAHEQARNPDVNFLIAEAIYEGYILALSDVAQTLNETPGVIIAVR